MAVFIGTISSKVDLIEGGVSVKLRADRRATDIGLGNASRAHGPAELFVR